jgi:hypothetical protein
MQNLHGPSGPTGGTGSPEPAGIAPPFRNEGPVCSVVAQRNQSTPTAGAEDHASNAAEMSWARCHFVAIAMVARGLSRALEGSWRFLGNDQGSLCSEPRTMRFSRVCGDSAQRIRARRPAALSRLKHGLESPARLLVFSGRAGRPCDGGAQTPHPLVTTGGTQGGTSCSSPPARPLQRK